MRSTANFGNYIVPYQRRYKGRPFNLVNPRYGYDWRDRRSALEGRSFYQTRQTDVTKKWFVKPFLTTFFHGWGSPNQVNYQRSIRYSQVKTIEIPDMTRGKFLDHGQTNRGSFTLPFLANPPAWATQEIANTIRTLISHANSSTRISAAFPKPACTGYEVPTKTRPIYRLENCASAEHPGLNLGCLPPNPQRTPNPQFNRQVQLESQLKNRAVSVRDFIGVWQNRAFRRLVVETNSTTDSLKSASNGYYWARSYNKDEEIAWSIKVATLGWGLCRCPGRQ